MHKAEEERKKKGSLKKVPCEFSCKKTKVTFTFSVSHQNMLCVS